MEGEIKDREAVMSVQKILLFAMLCGLVSALPLAAKDRLAASTPKGAIITMDPKDVDPSDLPLDAISDLHTTGTPPTVDISAWRLVVTGPAVGRALSLTYDELKAMPTVKSSPILICSGVFADHAEWEGVPLTALLQKAAVRGSWSSVTFVAMDGYQEQITRKDAEAHLLYLAYKVNGETLPLAHGFPARLVAEDMFGSFWVKWIKEIRVE
jgi:sulfoxide reductase catalytic subunit YedY